MEDVMEKEAISSEHKRSIHSCESIGDVDARHINVLDKLVRFNLIGQSSAFLRSLNDIRKIARCDAPTLIQGETGTGKELAARIIHYQGRRHDHPFIPVNCGALPDALIENELFGHERGAYTDAGSSSKGLIFEAEGGTLFLDEVDALPSKGQVSLLRFLEEQEYRPLGSGKIRKVDVRVISSANTVLEEATTRGEFRHDLFYRLNVLPLNIPPLREREGDVGLLAEHFLKNCQTRHNEQKSFHCRLIAWMNHQYWPGNVRELKNFIEREFLLADGQLIDISRANDLPTTNNSRAYLTNNELTFHEAKAQAVEEFERDYLRKLMVRTAGNVTHAAQLAGKERRALGKLLKKYNIDRSQFVNNH